MEILIGLNGDDFINNVYSVRINGYDVGKIPIRIANKDLENPIREGIVLKVEN